MHNQSEQDAAVGAAEVQPTEVPTPEVAAPAAEAGETKIVVQLPKLTPSQTGKEWEYLLEQLGNLESEQWFEAIAALKELAPEKMGGLLMQLSERHLIPGIADELHDSLDAPYSFDEIVDQAKELAVTTVYVFADSSSLQIDEDHFRVLRESRFYEAWKQSDEYKAARAEAKAEAAATEAA